MQYGTKLFGLFNSRPMKSQTDVRGLRRLFIKWNPLIPTRNNVMHSIPLPVFPCPPCLTKPNKKRKTMHIDINIVGMHRYVFLQSVDFTARKVTDYSFAVTKGVNIPASLYDKLNTCAFTIVDPQKRSTEDNEIWLDFFRFNMTPENIVKYDFNKTDDKIARQHHWRVTYTT